MEIFSSANESAGDKQATIRQYEFPPSDYFSKDVSFESRYGMWAARVFLFLLPCSANEVITWRKVNRDLLMSIASLAARPVFPVWDERSEPARSTSYNFERIWESTLLFCVISHCNEKIAWERELAWFKLWLATILFLTPLLYIWIACSSSLHRKTNRFSTANYSFLDQRIFKPVSLAPGLEFLREALFNKSYTFSL